MKSILITGCSEGGIGHALALAFHSKGLLVLATARKLESMTSLKAAGIQTFALDVTNAESIAGLHAQVDQLLGGRLDFLVNNAGIDYAVPAIEADSTKVRQVFETNVLALMEMCQTFSGMLMSAGGTIVNHASVLGTSIVIPFGSHYNASKAAVISYSNTLRVELKPFGVHVTTLVTGEVASNVLRSDTSLPAGSLYKEIQPQFAIRAGGPEGVKMSAAEYAQSVSAKILSPTKPAEIWKGTNSSIIWFLTHFVPRVIHNRLTVSQFNLKKLTRRTKVD